MRARDSNRLQSEILLKSLHTTDEDGAMLALTENVEGRAESHDNNSGGVVFRDVVESYGEVYFTDIPDSLGTTPLMLAAGRNMLPVVFRLIDMGAPLNAGNRHGHNPLIWACICGHTEVIKTLLYKGADINHVTAEGRTALHYTCLYAKPKAAEVLFNFLFEKFQTFRLDHPRKKPDPSRWSKYAVILENFCNIKDNTGKKPNELIPAQAKSGGLEMFAVGPAASMESLSQSDALSSSTSFAGKTHFSDLLSQGQLRDDILPLPPFHAVNRSVDDKYFQPESANSVVSFESGGYLDGSESITIDDQTVDDNSFAVLDVGEEQGRSLSSSVITLDTDNFLSGLHGLNDSRSLLSAVTGTEDILSLEDVFSKTEVGWGICAFKINIIALDQLV